MMAAALVVLAGCGSKEEGGGKLASGSAGVAPAAAAPADDSVAAALLSEGAPLATVRFSLPERPGTGEPFPLKLVFTAPQAGAVLQARIETSGPVAVPDSLELDFTAATTTSQELVLTAQKEGMAELVVKITTGDSAAETAYAIPLLVGAPAAP
jgi:hypothetical protein